jgi:hypothetical protein
MARVELCAAADPADPFNARIAAHQVERDLSRRNQAAARDAQFDPTLAIFVESVSVIHRSASAQQSS